mgnify:CR=1 FL=1
MKEQKAGIRPPPDMNNMANGTQQIRREQALARVMAAAAASAQLRTPKLGWIHTARTALGMSGASLARRMNQTRPSVANLENSEREGRATLRSLREAAEAMNCELVYALVPKGGNVAQSQEEAEAQAERKARRLVGLASTHMALEAQRLSDSASKAALERLRNELVRSLPRDFWDDEPDPS